MLAGALTEAASLQGHARGVYSCFETTSSLAQARTTVVLVYVVLNSPKFVIYVSVDCSDRNREAPVPSQEVCSWPSNG